MPRGTPALVRPALLVWARESAGFAIDAAAAKSGFDPADLHKWESGEDRPSIPQLRKLGEIYRRPLAVFFLAEAPTTFDAQREFRRLAGVTPQNESPALRQALRVALFRREVAKEIFERLDEAVPTLDAAAHPEESADEVGARMRSLLGITWEQQLRWSDSYSALRAWREAIERLGIFVFQVGDVELSEMRGTSVPHGPLPIIVMNNADAPHGRVFTLLHEFAHILLFNGGHRTSPMEGERLPEDQHLEQISNRFAAAALMPQREFLAELPRYSGALVGDEDSLRRFAERIKVSPEAILRRLLVLRRVRLDVYRERRRAWQARSWYQGSQGGGPPIETRVLSSAGRSFVSLVVDGYQRNAVSSSDVSDFLGIQLKFLSRITDALAPGPGSIGAR